EDGIRDDLVTGVQTCALPISQRSLYDVKCEGVISCVTSVFLTSRFNFPGKAHKKPPPVPSKTLLRTRSLKRVPQCRVLDPTTRWACKRRTQFWLPAGKTSVRQK